MPDPDEFPRFPPIAEPRKPYQGHPYGPPNPYAQAPHVRANAHLPGRKHRPWRQSPEQNKINRSVRNARIPITIAALLLIVSIAVGVGYCVQHLGGVA